MKIVNEDTGVTLFNDCEVAEKFYSRLRGLLGKASISEEFAMVFPNCKSVHTYWMKFSIDVIFLNRDKVVIKIIENLRPSKFTSCLSAEYVVETLAGEVENKKIRVNDRFLLL